MNAPLKRLLAARRARHRSGASLRWLVIGLLGLTLPLAILALADSRLVLSVPWRWLGFSIFCLAALAMLLGIPRALRAPREEKMAALLDESSDLKGGYAIATSRELDSTGGTPEAEALLTRLHAAAEKLAATAYPARPRPRAWQWLGAALGLGLFAFVHFHEGHLPIARILEPWKKLPYTTLSLTGPVKKPLAGEPFEIAGRVSGRIPDRLTLAIQGGAAIAVPVAADGSYRQSFEKGLPVPAVMVAHAGRDGISTPLELALGDIPRPRGYEQRIVPPAYTAQPERVETSASFSMLRASRVATTVTFDRPPTGVRMIFDNDVPTLDLEVDPSDPRVWRSPLPELVRTSGYQLEVADEDGVYRSLGEPQQIVVLPDKAPAVEVTSHNGEKLKSPRDTFTMKFQASDDVGLAGIRVVYRRIGDQAQQAKSIPLSEIGVRKQNGEWQLPLAELKAAPHDLVSIVLQAADGNTLDGPGIGSADPIVIEIPDEPAADEQGGGGGGGGGGEQVNPLEIQRQLYRDTLRLSVGRKAPPQAELKERQQKNVTNLEEMAVAKRSGDPIYVGLLEIARKAAEQAALMMEPDPYQRPGRLDKSLAFQAQAIDALLKASRMEGKQSPGEGEGEGGKQFSLTRSSSPSNAPPSEEEQKEKIEQAVADIKEALKKQQEINQELGEFPAAGQQEPAEAGAGAEPGKEGAQAGTEPGEGQGQGEGQSPGEGQGQSPGQGQGPGQNPGGQNPGGPPPPPGAGQQLAGRQNQVLGMSQNIQGQLEAVQKTDSGADPAMAVEQLKLASEYQRAAAAQIAAGAAGAKESGKASAGALEQAQKLAESLLGETPETGAEPQLQALEYRHLIQQYSRRISYDQ